MEGLWGYSFQEDGYPVWRPPGQIENLFLEKMMSKTQHILFLRPCDPPRVHQSNTLTPKHTLLPRATQPYVLHCFEFPGAFSPDGMKFMVWEFPCFLAFRISSDFFFFNYLSKNDIFSLNYFSRLQLLKEFLSSTPISFFFPESLKYSVLESSDLLYNVFRSGFCLIQANSSSP